MTFEPICRKVFALYRKEGQAIPMNESAQQTGPQDQAEQPVDSGQAPQLGAWSNANTLLLVAGVLVLFLGFIDLSWVDEMAENIHGIISPLMILGGYFLVFLSIILNQSKA